MKTNKYEIDMCNGSIMDKLISFALPLMLSGILQLMFNAVDIVVVGHFTGKQALAAVGSTTALINVFTNLFIGISLGANVLAARFFASGREKEMSDTVHTAILLALISGILMAGIGVISAKGALLLMGTPDNVIAQSTLYMRIYFLGMPFFDLYVSSTSCRYRKPNIKGLCDIAVYFGIKPDEMIFIGDERKDVLVANDFGCTSVYIDRYNNNRDFGQKFTVKDLNGFYDIVTKL